jgi:hypothetical protein
MAHLPDLFHSQNVVRTVSGTVAAVDTNLRLVVIVIPKHGAKGTRLSAIAAANAQVWLEAHTATRSHRQRIGRANSRARRIGTRPADDHDESFADAAGRVNADTRGRQPALAHSPRAGKHARLTTNTTFCIHHSKSFCHLFPSNSIGKPLPPPRHIEPVNELLFVEIMRQLANVGKWRENKEQPNRTAYP